MNVINKLRILTERSWWSIARISGTTYGERMEHVNKLRFSSKRSWWSILGDIIVWSIGLTLSIIAFELALYMFYHH